MRSSPRSGKKTSENRTAARQRTQRVSWARLAALIEDATMDAHDQSEQRLGFFTMLADHLDMPFTTEVLGVEVTVADVDLTEADEIVAICRRGRHRQAIAILELPLPKPPPSGWEWIEAFRHWAGGT